MGWPLKEKDIKRYPHFDAATSLPELERLATDPELVRKHAFFPFLLYHKSWKPFRYPESRPQRKTRPIRYAARRDSAIFSYYRFLLAEHYEAALAKLGIETCPVAYRKLKQANSSRGKCNIDFAADAFTHARTLGTCCAVTMDIKSFFESIDHAHLKKTWMHLLGKKDLPSDHAAVFKAITKYAVVDRDQAYERLGFIGDKVRPTGQNSKGFLKSRNDMPTQLCSPSDFRTRICGNDKTFSNLVERNKFSFGIPQGAPISDLLANIYLIDFDVLTHKYVTTNGGVYFRYSDDIFILLPGGAETGKAAAAFVTEQIQHFGNELKIKESKTAIVAFTQTDDGNITTSRVDRPKSRTGISWVSVRR
jgi:hypothetical protein